MLGFIVKTPEISLRNEKTKTELKKIRSQKWIPAVLYGLGQKCTPIKIQEKNLYAGEIRENAIIKVKFENSELEVITKNFQIDVLSNKIAHIDLIRVSPSSRIKIKVPVTFINKDLSPGIKLGGVLNVVTPRVEIQTTVSTAPKEFICDLSKYKIGDVVSLLNLDKQDVKYIHPVRDRTIATIIAPKSSE